MDPNSNRSNMNREEERPGGDGLLQQSFLAGGEDSNENPYPYWELGDEEKLDILVSILGLQSIKGIGFKTLCSMFDSGLLTEFWDLDYAELVRRWERLESKTSSEIPRAVIDKRDEIRRIGTRQAEELSSDGVSFIAYGHSSYPPGLKRLEEPPRWLFLKGDNGALLKSAVIAIVGTREPSIDGERLSYRTAEELVKRNVVVLSGLAKGIDENAHLGAVDNFGVSIAVLGHGISTAYASVNEKLWNGILRADGAILSEYLPSDPPSRSRFLRRNELQVALSQAVIPVETPSLQSGTGATIRRAQALQVPIVGVIPKDTNVKPLKDTKKNLEEIGAPVFEVMGEKSQELWEHLRKIVPAHDWQVDPAPRQDRYLRSIEEIVDRGIGKVGLDGTAIDRLASRLKRRIEEKKDQKGND